MCVHIPLAVRGAPSRSWVGLVYMYVCTCACACGSHVPSCWGPCVCMCARTHVCLRPRVPSCPGPCVCMCVHLWSCVPPARLRPLTPRPWCVVGALRSLLSAEHLVASGRCPARSPMRGSDVRSSWPRPPRSTPRSPWAPATPRSRADHLGFRQRPPAS